MPKPFILIVAILASVATSAQAQPAETQPATTQPAAAPPTPTPVPTTQSTPLKMVQFFLKNAEAAESDPDRLEDAKACLNFSTLDPVVVQQSAADYVAAFAAVLKRLQAEKIFDLTNLPDTPVVDPPPTIGRDPLLLNLQRGASEESKIWLFAPTTVERILDMQKNLDAHIDKIKNAEASARTPASEAEQQLRTRLRSPHALMQFFFIKATEAQEDSAAYADAMQALDFSLLDWNEQQLKQNGPNMVRMLLTILGNETTPEIRDKLPKVGELDGKETWQVVNSGTIIINVARQADGRWLFASQTVKDIERMYAESQKRKEEEQAKAGADAKSVTSVTEIPFDNSSAAATLNTFLRAMYNGDVRTAVECLDLSELTDAERQNAATIAGKIYLTLNRKKLIIPADYIDAKKTVTFIDTVEGRIAIAPKRSGPREGEWLFTARTVRRIDKLYDLWEQKPIIPELRDRKRKLPFLKFPSLYVREYIVPEELKGEWLKLQIWQWYGLALIAIIATIVRYTAGAVFPPLVRRVLSTKDFAILPRTAQRQLRPTMWLLTLLTIWLGLQLLDFGTAMTGAVWSIMRVLLALVAVFAVYRLVDLLGLNLNAWSARTNSRLDDLLVPLLQKTAKVIAIAAGSILVVNAIGYNVTPLLAGLGLGGLAFGLAAQDTLKNFFGSVNVILDRPFQVGDYVKINSIEGTVESVGLRSSRVRTPYQSQIIVPNSELMNASIDNWGRRKYRLLRTRLGVLYSTSPEQLEAFCEGIRELVRQHPNTRKDAFDIWVNEFAESSINVFLNVFFESPDWSAELQARHHFAIAIIRLAKRLGVDFAFPTRTLHIENGANEAESSAPPSPPAPPLPPDVAGAGAAARNVVAEILKDFPYPAPTAPAAPSTANESPSA